MKLFLRTGVGLAMLGLSILPAAVQARIRASTPVTITIPKIGVKATIEPRGLTRSGFMAVPSSGRTVAWYSSGAIPGQPGDAVMYGHFTGQHFEPAVFYNINKLKVNDRVIVKDTNGNTHTFRITKLVAYRRDHMTFEQLDGRSKYSHLNFYTCAGHWSPSAHEYTHFLIVYSTLVSSVPPR